MVTRARHAMALSCRDISTIHRQVTPSHFERFHRPFPVDQQSSTANKMQRPLQLHLRRDADCSPPRFPADPTPLRPEQQPWKHTSSHHALSSSIIHLDPTPKTRLQHQTGGLATKTSPLPSSINSPSPNGTTIVTPFLMSTLLPPRSSTSSPRPTRPKS